MPPPLLKTVPSLQQIIVKKIVQCKAVFGKLYQLEEDLFEPVPSEIVDSILEELSCPSCVESSKLTANEICMLITSSTSRLDLSKFRAFRNQIDHSFICDALGTRCADSLLELKLCRWILPASSLAFITLLCRQIRVLDLSFGRVTDDHIEILAQSCLHLKKLNVQDEEQKISPAGLRKIADAKFQLESLIITGRTYDVNDIVRLLVNQKRLTHLRIANLISALFEYVKNVSTDALTLSHLILLEVGSRVNKYQDASLDISPILANVTALEIDLTLFSNLLKFDPKDVFGLSKLTSLRDLKIRETIGSKERQNLVKLWNRILSFPGFHNITFLQLESGLCFSKKQCS